MSEHNNAQQAYEAWLADPHIDETTKEELRGIAHDAHEIEDRFYTELTFGTGGLRGIIGAGTNRINRYTIGKATQGLAAYVLAETEALEASSGSLDERHPSEGKDASESAGTDGASESAGADEGARAGVSNGPSVAIAYDCRHQSATLALEAALVLAGNGIRAYVFESLRPTPELSYAVRQLKATAGIVITASHNPPEYNGFKVYGSDGGQLVDDAAHRVISYVRDVESLAHIKQMSETEAVEAGLLHYLGAEMDEKYIKAVSEVSLNEPHNPAFNEHVRIVYTPLHGSGNKLVRQALESIGCTQVHIVEEQEAPDPDFSTVQSPNPEEPEAFTLALQLAKQVDADLIIGTDPDADRMGAIVKRGTGEYEILSGNQIGSLLTHYILSRLHQAGRLPQHGAIIKTIVTSEFGAVIAESFGISTINTLTGFKYIGELMTAFEQTQEHQFLFGYEESYGYLAGTYARDKDAIVASMLLCEATAYYKETSGQSLYDVLQQLYEQHGFYAEALETRTLKGVAGVATIKRIMDQFRENPPVSIAGIDIVKSEDYSEGIDNLPVANVLKYTLADGSWFCLRPSGTEPKIKIYFSVVTTSAGQSAERLQQLVSAVMARVDE